MNTAPENPNPDPPGNDLMSVEEFEKACARNPELRDRVVQSAKRAVAGEYGELTPELIQNARAVVNKHEQQQAVQAIIQKLKALVEVLSRPAKVMSMDEKKAQGEAMLEDIVDSLLETPEPIRTQFLKQLLPIREELRAINSQKS